MAGNPAIIYGEAGQDFDDAIAAVEAAKLSSIAVPLTSPTIDAGATNEEIIAGTKFVELPTVVETDQTTVHSGLTAIEAAELS